MIKRLVTGVVAALLTVAVGVAAPTAAAAASTTDPVSAQHCVRVTLDQVRGVYRPDSTFWEPWFDATVRGWSRPCGSADATTLAITQYHVRDGATVGLMSTPWQTAPRGTTAFSRFGRIEPDIAALCVSTGLDRRADAVVARNAVCVRPVRTGADHLVTRFAPVPLTDPLVTSELSEYPADGTAPTGPVCSVDCLVSPFITYPSSPHTTRDTPIDGPTEPLSQFEPLCHTVSITDSFAGPSDENVNGFDVWMTGTVDSCDPEGPVPTIHAIRYWPDRGIVMPPWDLGQFPVLAKGAQVNENTGAICLASGMRERGGRMYGVHDLCWRIARDQPDRYRLVPIRTDDPRVRQPLVSNIAVPDPDEPPGVCASCL
jgi:hypothetical protein